MHSYFKKKFLLIFSIISIIIFFLIILINFNNNKKAKIENKVIEFKLITSTHKSLPWQFEPSFPSIKIKIGEVTNVEYRVKNLSSDTTSGIASFIYYPKELASYIVKIECFCYDVKTLKAGDEKKYILTMMIDPKVTKDSNTKHINEGIIQFTFFDSKNFKKNNS